MKTPLFVKDYAHKTINITCSFETPLSVVWDAFSNPVTLEKWFAPEPYKAVTKTADFKEGGHWLYYMLSPEGQKHWGITQYKKIEVNKFYEAFDAFCDENGTIDTTLPQLNWMYNFSEKNGITTVQVAISLASEEEMKRLLEMGFEEGFQIGLNQLQKLLKTTGK